MSTDDLTEPVETGVAGNGTDFAVFPEGVEAGVTSQGEGYIDIGGKNHRGQVLFAKQAEQFARALLAAVAWADSRRSSTLLGTARAEADPYRHLREHLRWDQVTS